MLTTIVRFHYLLTDTIEFFLAFFVFCQHNSKVPTYLDVENFELLVDKPLEKAWVFPFS